MAGEEISETLIVSIMLKGLPDKDFSKTRMPFSDLRQVLKTFEGSEKLNWGSSSNSNTAAALLVSRTSVNMFSGKYFFCSNSGYTKSIAFLRKFRLKDSECF